MSELCQCTCGKPGCQSRRRSESGCAHGTARRYEQGCRCAACRERKSKHDAVKATRRYALTRPRAKKHGNQWTSAELEFATRGDLTVQEIALTLGRTYKAVSQIRFKCRHEPKYIEMLGAS